VDQPPLWRLLALEPDVLEIVRIPQRVEIPLDCGLIVNVARTRKDAGSNGVGWDAAVAPNVNRRDDVLLSQSKGAEENQTQPQA
jgi:hypothetical protein